MLRTCLVATLLLGSLSAARAEGPTATPVATRPSRASKVPFRAVRLLPDTGQALVYDRARKLHTLVAVGDTVSGYQIVDVTDDELVLAAGGRELVLVIDPTAPQPPDAASPTGPTGLRDPYASPAPAASTTSAAGGLRDPYASAALPASPPGPASPTGLRDPYAAAPAAPVPSGPVAATTGPLDPYAAAAGPRTVLAPPDQRASLQETAPVDPYAEPKVVAAPSGALPVQGVPAPSSEAARAAELRTDVMTLSRAQLQAEVKSFDKLAKDIGFEKTGRGVRLRQVAPDSYAYTLGLRGGDVITAIDGAPLRSLDDAAGAYVRLATASKLSLDVERGAARGTLRFALK